MRRRRGSAAAPSASVRRPGAGAAVGPICAGVLADHFGIMAAFYFLAGTIIVANLIIFVTPSGNPKNP
jgi:MFS family permease